MSRTRGQNVRLTPGGDGTEGLRADKSIEGRPVLPLGDHQVGTRLKSVAVEIRFHVTRYILHGLQDLGEFLLEGLSFSFPNFVVHSDRRHRFSPFIADVKALPAFRPMT